MERILKEYKNNSPNHYNEEISLIAHLANLTEEEIVSNEIEAASNIIHCAFKKIFKDYCYAIQNILNERKGYITLNGTLYDEEYKICINNSWLFRIIVINSVKHSECLNNSSNNDCTHFLNSVIEHIIKDIDIVKPLSLHLLKTLFLILTKLKNTLSPNLSREILTLTNKVALSPITVFRQYARGISKVTIFSLPPGDTTLLNISLLPIRGVEMCDIIKRFTKSDIRMNQHQIVKKVLNMFLKNVESKDGGALYDCLLFYSFEEWKTEIWPLFLDDLKNIDYEGEFFHSLLKYWITLSVNAYKHEFYIFLRKQPVDDVIKCYVLLESRRKGCTNNSDILKSDILTMFANIETKELALKIATTYHKKSVWPMKYEIDIVLDYLYSNSKMCLDEEESRSLKCFFSQIFLHAHNELKKNEEKFSFYASVVENCYKYCCDSLKSDYFEVGAEIVFIIWTIATGCHKDLRLSYKLEKRDFYDFRENVFYKRLNEKNIWRFHTGVFQQELIKCFWRNNGFSTYLTKLFTKYFEISFLSTFELKTLVNETVLQTSLDSEKRIKNYAEIIYQNQHCDEKNLKFLGEITEFLTNLNTPQENCFSEEIMFKVVLYLQIITIARKYDKYDAQNLHYIVERCLQVVEEIIINNNSLSEVNYKGTKILEAAINSIMICMIENVDILWRAINKKKVMKQLITIIQRGNMKRPLSLSVEVLKCFGSKMDDNDSDRNDKIHFLNETLKSLYEATTRADLRIRRNPESRLVIHAMCSSERNPNKPLLKWVLPYLLQVITNPNSSDSAVASTLHTLEILISDNTLQSPTLPFISDIIVQCVKLFVRNSWIVRNADLQLTRAVIDRFYGVCLNICDRPKCVEDLLILFPNLSSYFYKILCSDQLDERAVLVFQFFSESQTKDQIFTSDVPLNDFRRLFINILQKYPNYIGKMAARSYSALCTSKSIPNQVCSIVDYLKTNFRFLKKNIFVNFIFLIRQLYEKYSNSFSHCIREDKINVVDFALKDLLHHLRKCDSHIFDFILFKVKPRSVILNEFVHNSSGDYLKQRIWLHNNIPFLIINIKPREISSLLQRILSTTLPSFVQIKILTIIISRFEKKEFDSKTTNEILHILFGKSTCVEVTDNYLLKCYFKTILVIYECNNHCSDIKKGFLPFQITSNIYKIMIYVLYFSKHTKTLSDMDRQSFYNLVQTTYKRTISFNDEMKNDVISTLPYLLTNAPKEIQLNILKLIFYFSLFTPNYLAAYKCMNFVSGKSYCSIFSALKDFFSVNNLLEHLKDKMLVLQFFNDVTNYIPEHCQRMQPDGYYSEESDILVPKLFLERLINSEIRKL